MVLQYKNCTLALSNWTYLVRLFSYGFDIYMHAQMIPGFDQRRDISVKIQNNEQVFMSLNHVHIKLLTNWILPEELTLKL